MRDRDVINAFVHHLEGLGHPRLRVERWPEDDNQVPRDMRIDAIAGPFAIEHTSIDTVPEQRAHSARFDRVLGNQEERLRGKLTFRLTVAPENSAIAPGQDWDAMQAAFDRWVLHEAAKLPDGWTSVDNVPGIPFTFRARKESDRPAGVFPARMAPPEDCTLPDRIREQLGRKASKLAPYSKMDKIRVLLIESNDMALMNAGIMLEAIQKAYSHKLPGGVDQVWYIDTSEGWVGQFLDFTDRLAGGA